MVKRGFCMQKSGLQEYVDHMNRWKNRVYLVGFQGYRQRRWSYGEVHERILILSRQLMEAGVHKGKRVILFGKSSPEWVVAFFAILYCGAVVVPLDPGTPADLVSSIVQRTSPIMIISDMPMEFTGVETLNLAIIDDTRENHNLKSSTGTYESTGLGESAGFAESAGFPKSAGPVPTSLDDVAEIVFTSGTTSQPKGVVLNHRNILANLSPIEEGIQKRIGLVRFLTPFRLLCTVPFSHMFGQATGIFLPILIGSTVYFAQDTGPAALIRAIRRNRILTLIAVPRILKLLADHVKSELSARGRLKHFEHRWERWVKLPYPLRVLFFLDVHRMLGLHFWSFIVGGAALDQDTHEFWRRLVYSVFQGYGLTETAPMVSMFNPFRHSRTSVGKLFPGQEVKIGTDGEILIKGENVMAGYWDDPEASASVLQDGWLQTGDIGEIDDEGHLYIKGRKKDMIVTADGHNVYAGDVESVLNRTEGVKEAAVVGLPEGGQEQVHAVLILEPGTDPARTVRLANEKLLPYQKIKGYTIWEESDFPRTSTQKVRKIEILRRIQGEKKITPEAKSPFAHLTAGTEADDSLRVSDLGMSSLDLVQTIGEIEKKYHISIDETMLGPDVTVGQIKELASHPQTARQLPMPRWARWPVTRLFRSAVRVSFLFPVFRCICRVKAKSLENVSKAEHHGILAANHTSDLDPVAVLLALPYRMRRLVAPALGLNRFHPHFRNYGNVSAEERRIEGKRFLQGSLRSALYGFAYLVITFLFQTFPFPQGTALRSSFEYIGELLDRECWILIFPEGTVSNTGELQSFRGGVAHIAEKTKAPVYPVAISGMHEVLPPGRRWPRSNRIEVSFGKPMIFEEGDTQDTFTEKLEHTVRTLLQRRNG